MKMPDFIDGSENVSVHGIMNWIRLCFCSWDYELD